MFISCFQLIFISSLGYLVKTVYSLYENNLISSFIIEIDLFKLIYRHKHR